MQGLETSISIVSNYSQSQLSNFDKEDLDRRLKHVSFTILKEFQDVFQTTSNPVGDKRWAVQPMG